MKKYLLFLIAILSVSLTSCSVDDDYCGNDFYKSKQLAPVYAFHPDNFRVYGLKGERFTVIKSEQEFQERVRGAQYYKGAIDFRYDELIIGQTYATGFNSIIDITPMYRESCGYGGENLLEVEINVNRGNLYTDFIVYHTVVPRTKSDRYSVLPTVRYRSR
ncbi:MAG: hypothetical protein LBI73_03005 [Myroides sp.]|jgi:hypothetical protein|nr:hypothetical protein [Myroides sp.]